MDFLRAKETYRKNAAVQQKMAKKLVKETKEKAGETFEKILEIGAGTGFLTDETVKNLNFRSLFLNDLTPNYTNFTPEKYYEGDFLKVKIKETFDLILSNAMIQWVEDKEGLLNKAHTLLKENGIFAFTTFGKKNFIQIKETTGFGLNYEDLTPKIKETGFEILYYEEELQTLYFENVRKILEHIRATGVGSNNECFWTKSKYENFTEAYLKSFSDNNGVELTYHPIYFICKRI